MQGLGSDRTSITGVWEGVGSYFKREILTLVQRHCISHWLALAEKDSSTSAAYLEFFFFFLHFGPSYMLLWQQHILNSWP